MALVLRLRQLLGLKKVADLWVFGARTADDCQDNLSNVAYIESPSNMKIHASSLEIATFRSCFLHSRE